MTKEITVEEAATLLHTTPMTVRLALRSKRVDWGFAVQGEGKSGSWIYVIYPDIFEKLTGCKIPEKGETTCNV